MKKEWRKIPNYERYSVSNYGEIRSEKRQGTQGVYRKQRKQNSGYYICDLYKNNKQKTLLIHRLVALVFIPNPKNKPCVNHINGIKTDNRLINLEWVTYSENNEHTYKIGNKKTKQVVQFDLSMNLISVFSSTKIASQKTNCSVARICDVCNGKKKQTKGFIFKYQ